MCVCVAWVSWRVRWARGRSEGRRKVIRVQRVQPSLQSQSERGMLRLLLLVLLLQLLCSADDMESPVMIYHKFRLEPDRKKYIWNPFPGFCGPNATMVRCGGVCPETCSFKSSRCTAHCGVPCKCKSGYVFSAPLLKCILRSDCPALWSQQHVDMHRVFQ